ncbi:MAG TPA: hypothetical protein VIN11_01310 [Roseivirga sp.]
MFESPEYPKALDEKIFEQWLEDGRESKMRYEYMLVLWDELDQKYCPEYINERSQFNSYPIWGTGVGHQYLIAIYDLFSESRIAFTA